MHIFQIMRVELSGIQEIPDDLIDFSFAVGRVLAAHAMLRARSDVVDVDDVESHDLITPLMSMLRVIRSDGSQSP